MQCFIELPVTERTMQQRTPSFSPTGCIAPSSGYVLPRLHLRSRAVRKATTSDREGGNPITNWSVQCAALCTEGTEQSYKLQRQADAVGAAHQ